MMRVVAVTIFIVAVLASIASAADEKAKILDVRKIWDAGKHNAFTDLLHRGDGWYCVFREGAGHVSATGAIRVLHSGDGETWKSAALVEQKGTDLRDPKISVAPDGRLMLLAAASWHAKDAALRRQPTVWFSKDGKTWGEGTDVGEKNYWLWRVTWRGGVGRGIGYQSHFTPQEARLYETRDGVTYKTLVKTLHNVGRPGESSILYLPDATALCLLRRDGTPNSGLLGTAKAPYTEWTWKDLGVRIGGPHMLQVPDGRIVAAVRFYGDAGARSSRTWRTSLAWIDSEKGTIDEFLRLPSGGDTSYAGLVWHEDKLWVSYYSSHEGKTSIYLAKVQIPRKPSGE